MLKENIMKTVKILFIFGVMLFTMNTLATAGTVTPSMGVGVTVSEYLKLIIGCPPLGFDTRNGGIVGGKVCETKKCYYTITTNRPNTKLSANLASAMVPGILLNVIAAAPAGATSAGKVSLDITAKDLVAGIPPIADSKNDLTFELCADLTTPIGANPATSILFTLTAP